MKILVLVGMVLGYSACDLGGEQDITRVNNRRGWGQGTPTGPNQRTGPYPGIQEMAWGEITNGADLTSNVQGLMSSMEDPNVIVGPISGVGGGNTGVRFQGRVETLGGQPANGQMSLRIWDSSGSSPITMSFTLVEGSVSESSGSMSLVFESSGGSLHMQGPYVIGQYFQGTIFYENFYHWAGSQPASGELGSFQIPTCGFLICY